MKRATLRARVVGAASAVALVAAMTVALTGGSAGAADPTPSDPDRADFFSGNATTCADVGFPGSILAFADGTDSINDGNVSGDVVGGTTVNVDDPPVGVVIQAVVVKGGPAYNVYSTSSGSDNGDHVPPTEDTPTEYISPLNGGGQIPTVSHWFICYTSDTPPETGSLSVTKVVEPLADGLTPLETIPTVFHFEVDCTDGTSDDFDLPVDEEGVPNFTHVTSPIDAGATCTVVETTVLPDGSTTTYDPAGADGEGVDIVGGEQTAVEVTNNFEGVELAPANVVAPPAPLAPAPAPIVAAGRFTG